VKDVRISEEDQCIEAYSPISSPSKVHGFNFNGNCDTQQGQEDNGALLKTLQTVHGTGAKTEVSSEACHGISSGASNGELSDESNKPTVTSSSIQNDVL
jgi:hypothetical protein